MFRWSVSRDAKVGGLTRGCSGCRSSRSRGLWLRHIPHSCFHTEHSLPHPLGPVHFWSSHTASPAMKHSTEVARLFPLTHYNLTPTPPRRGEQLCRPHFVTHRGRVKHDALDVCSVVERSIFSDDKGLTFILHHFVNPTILCLNTQEIGRGVTKYTLYHHKPSHAHTSCPHHLMILPVKPIKCFDNKNNLCLFL